MKVFLVILLCFNFFAKLTIPAEIKKKFTPEQQMLVYYANLVNLFKMNYFKKFTNEELLEKSVKGFLSEFDPYTSFIDEKTLALLQETTDAEFGGIGVEILPIDGFVKILNPLENSPAFKAGIRPGDVITHIDGKFIYKELYDLVIKKLRGAPGSKVILTIKRRYKEPFNVTVERDIIKIPFVKYEIYNRTLYLRIGMFYSKLASDVRKILEKYRTVNLKSVIIDLRYNPGGLLQEAVALSNLFLGKGHEIVTIKSKMMNVPSIETVISDKDDILNGLPIVIIINSNSASASEIFAGNMQYAKRAVIVGDDSFGKGSVQNLIPLPGNVAIKITTAKFFVGNKCMDYNGVHVDVKSVPESLGYYPVRNKDFSVEWQASEEAERERKKIRDINEIKDESKKEKIVKDLDLKKKLDIEKDDKNSEEDYIVLLFKELPISERLKKDVQLKTAFLESEKLSVKRSNTYISKPDKKYVKDYMKDMKNVNEYTIKKASDFASSEGFELKKVIEKVNQKNK